MREIYWEISRYFEDLRLYEYEKLVFLCSIPVTLIVILASYRWGIKKLKAITYLKDEDISYFKKLLYLEITFLVISSLIWLPWPLHSMVYAPFSLAASVLPLLILIRILIRKYEGNKTIDLLSIKNQEDLNEKIGEILDSKNFLTALRSTLPKGEKDEEYGLDFIPYMLKNVDERRERFSRRAYSFLITSVSTGLIFVAITIWLGYIILDEDSIGTGRKIRMLEDHSKELNSKITFLAPDLYKEINDYSAIKRSINNIEELIKRYDGNEKSKLQNLISQFNDLENIDSLKGNLDNLTIMHSSKNDFGEPLQNEMRFLDESVDTFIDLRQSSIKDIPRILAKIENVIESADDEINGQNRTPEIIKRLVLSLVIISFFLAILRFLTNQYKNNFNQLILAEQEDLNIRKVYIALKTAGTEIESKKLVISELIKRTEIINESNKEGNKEQLDLIKTMLETLTKKL